MLTLKSQLVGLGIVIRDCLGFVLGASAQRVAANFSYQIVEALEIFRGLTFAVESGLLPIIESDALEVVNLINSGDNISSDVGLIIWDIRDLPHVVAGSVVVFESRKANVVLHQLSKLGMCIDKDQFYMEFALR
ncbi:hypothetical protein Ddye_030074 [Dipteronia dyeriana]|uniref:RNase H type-1 domain-containing protein n=1 Tax=Dipteronia dyeriana TaxID=168575 RepID=A0AAD9WM49_9ROSI|nr:hypothetical protein Ddye_030074 [Dipteronia dyeriana]